MSARTAERARAREADVWVVVALVLVAAVIRLLVIDNQSLWADEALTAYETHLPFGAMITTILHVETTPPLYFVLEWGWAHVFGTGVVSLRMISTIAGIALVPIAYLAARELVSRRAGVLAAAIIAVNPFMIWYSQEARSYMLLAALTGGGFLYFARASREPSRSNLTGWALLSAAAVMTHFFAGFAVAPEAIWLICGRDRLARVAVAFVGAAQLAVVPFAIADTGHGVGWIATTPKVNRIAHSVLEWGIGVLFRRATIAEGLIGGAVLTAAIAALVLRAGDHRTRRQIAPAVAICAFALVVPLLLAFAGQDYVYARNLIPAFLPVTVVVAAACTAPRARIAGGVLAGALLVMFAAATTLVQTRPYLQRPNWQAVAAALGPATVPRAILASNAQAAQPLKLYLANVSWVQHHGSRVLIGEIDVVGARKRERLVPLPSDSGSGLRPHSRFGEPFPSIVPPPGTKLLARFRVRNWMVARFALIRPARFSINQLNGVAPNFFKLGRAPVGLLVFMQPRER